MDLHLSGKTAVVTGASRGIGLAITRALVEEGVTVVAGARDVSGPLSEISRTGGVHPVSVDLSTRQGPIDLLEAAKQAVGHLDLLVNNVGAAHPRPGGFLSISDEEWISTLTLNFLAAVRTTRAALPLLLEQQRSAIVTVNSVNAVLPDPLVIDYSTAKSALASFSKSISKEFGARGLRANTVSPGPVSTDLWLGKDGVAARMGRVGNVDPESVAKAAAGESVTGRFTRPEEVADLVLLLASERSGNITGADILIDGGLTTML